MMKLKIPDNISSSQDIANLLIDVNEYSKWFAHESIKVSRGIKRSSNNPAMSPETREILNSWTNNKEITQHDLSSLIEALKKYKDTAPSITITLAAPPTVSIKTTLVAWCRKNIADNIIVNFQFNSTLLGGMVVRYGSRIFDWSFRRQILAARNNFPEVLNRV